MLIHLVPNSLSESFNTSSPANSIDYSVPNTLITLRFQLGTDILKPDKLQRTLLRTQLRLRRFIIRFPATVDVPLIGTDDPYISSPSDSNGAFFGVVHWPVYTPSRLTYGIVDTVLTGAVHVLCQEQNSISAQFLVGHDMYVDSSHPVCFIE